MPTQKIIGVIYLEKIFFGLPKVSRLFEFEKPIFSKMTNLVINPFKNEPFKINHFDPRVALSLSINQLKTLPLTLIHCFSLPIIFICRFLSSFRK